jgi:hypothetical protein
VKGRRFVGEASSAEAHSDEPDPMIGDGDGAHITMLPFGLDLHRQTRNLSVSARIEGAVCPEKPRETNRLVSRADACETRHV